MGGGGAAAHCSRRERIRATVDHGAGDEGQRVEAGVVGPVHVLDDQDRRRTASHVGGRVEQQSSSGRPLRVARVCGVPGAPT
jgi:hypothetical protein